MTKDYTAHETISLKNHVVYSEKWVQEIIANDPSVLRMGDLVLRDRERAQPRAGRLDLLLQDPETKRRYEVELQLGSTDEAHIIRTIEYWDIERKRYPQYDHCAVLIAEDITSRFLNVVSLFNGTLPLIAIQMQALRIGEKVTLVFTTVMDELSRGYIDEDEDAEAAPTDRAYWENRASKATVGLADQLLVLIKGIDPSLELKYNKFYIGLAKDGVPFNFITFRPRKKQLQFEPKIPQSDDLDAEIDKAGIDTLEYSTEVFAGLPAPPADWNNPQTPLFFKMPTKEREYLRRKLALLRRPGDGAQSLLARLVESRDFFQGKSSELPQKLDAHADSDDKRALGVARDAAALTAIGRTVYGALVEQLRGLDGGADGEIYRAQLSPYFATYGEAAGRCNLDVLEAFLPELPLHVRNVLRETRAYVRNGKPENFTTLRDSYQRAEVTRKTGRRARLLDTERSAQRRSEWDSGRHNTTPLHYRWDIVRDMLADLSGP